MHRFSLTIVIFSSIFFIFSVSGFAEFKETPEITAIVKEHCEKIVRIVGKFVEVLGNGHTNASFYEIITDFSAISYWIQEWIEVLKQISPKLSDKDSKHKNLYSVKQISNYFLIF